MESKTNENEPVRRIVTVKSIDHAYLILTYETETHLYQLIVASTNCPFQIRHRLVKGSQIEVMTRPLPCGHTEVGFFLDTSKITHAKHEMN